MKENKQIETFKRVDKIVKSQTKTSSYLRLKERNKKRIKSGFKVEDVNGKENEFVFFIFDTNLSLTVIKARHPHSH